MAHSIARQANSSGGGDGTPAAPGRHRLALDAALNSGVYFARAEVRVGETIWVRSARLVRLR